MANYAKVNNGIVEKVIVAESSYFDGFVDSSPGTWVETSETGAFRKNYAGVGMLYDSINEVFYQPQPYASWTLNKSTYIWEPPTAKPDDGKTYVWNESSKSWDEQ